MQSNVIHLRRRAGAPPPVAHYFRLGTSSHRQLEELCAAGRLTIARAVVQASAALRQTDLLRRLLSRGAELVLDTEITELSDPVRFSGSVRDAPWSRKNRPLADEDFNVPRGLELAAQIAHFAVRERFSAILAPSHIIKSGRDQLLGVDIDMFQYVHSALAKLQNDIALDYHLTLPYAVLCDDEQRAQIINALQELPLDNLWIRVSGFGIDATPTGVRRYIEALTDFAAIGKPVIADSVAGVPGLAAAAFGVVGGIAHGIGEREKFDANRWKRPRYRDGGLQKRLFIAPLDRHVNEDDVETILKASGGRKAIQCADASCCPTGVADTKRYPKAHYVTQRTTQVETLSKIPVEHRVYHFLKQQLEPMSQKAGAIARLAIGQSLKNGFAEQSKRFERLNGVLCDLVSAPPYADGSLVRSPSPIIRPAYLRSPARVSS